MRERERKHFFIILLSSIHRHHYSFISSIYVQLLLSTFPLTFSKVMSSIFHSQACFSTLLHSGPLLVSIFLVVQYCYDTLMLHMGYPLICVHVQKTMMPRYKEKAWICHRHNNNTGFTSTGYERYRFSLSILKYQGIIGTSSGGITHRFPLTHSFLIQAFPITLQINNMHLRHM